jgi:hypothetical protein
MTSATQSEYQFAAKLWRWPTSKAAWFFITLPAKISREIRIVDAGPTRRGFGALRTDATIGKSTWTTSIFPSKKMNTYLLPVKAAIRKDEKLAEGKSIKILLKVRRAA